MAQNESVIRHVADIARLVDGATVSVDTSTASRDPFGRVFGRVYSAQREGDGTLTLLAEATEDTREPDPLRELAEWLVSKDWMLVALRQIEGAPSEVLAEAITRAQKALGRTEGGDRG